MHDCRFRIRAALAVALICASSFSCAAEVLDPDGALASFVKRPSLTINDSTQWSTAISTLVGSYITKENGVIMLQGKGIGTTTPALQVDLKDGEVYRALISQKQTVGLDIVAFFKFNRSKEFLNELVITDLISATDPTLKLDSCIANRPAALASSKYWCITAITLSKITTRKYKKTNNTAKGTYTIATAEGTFQTDNNVGGVEKIASISVYGPILNGVLAPVDQPVVIAPAVINKSFTGPKTAAKIDSKLFVPKINELEGAKLIVPGVSR
ncbi:hypothetical protein F2P45_04860 [Massilia sp. CCM 8733]|uniref:Uncharacterized protein n=1 Tax=Massilia mucilaginosa TaxID=2609282 RepID=A0ABX0NNE4_9BURK|nr:hypothetical protein [Massilia mucilaginosa]NHZ88359.1 hypothetical protein [Massilia mucilaginosa]